MAQMIRLRLRSCKRVGYAGRVASERRRTAGAGEIVPLIPTQSSPGRMVDAGFSLLCAAWLICVFVSGHPAYGQRDDAQNDIKLLREQQLQTHHLHERARDRESELARQEGELRGEINMLRQLTVSLARETQGLEVTLDENEEVLAFLSATETRKYSQMRKRRERMTRFLAILQRIALRRPAGLMLDNSDASDLVRSALLVREAMRSVNRRVRVLHKELATLEALRLQIATRRAQRSVTSDQLVRQRSELEALIARKSQLLHKTKTARFAQTEAARQLAEDSRSLGELIVSLGLNLSADSAMDQEANLAFYPASPQYLDGDSEDKREANNQLRAGVPLAMGAPPVPQPKILTRRVVPLPPFDERRILGQKKPGSAPKSKGPESKGPESKGPESKGKKKVASPRKKTASRTRVARRKSRVRKGSRLAAGSLVAPSRGRIVQRFGEKMENNAKAKGVTLAGRNRSVVIAPSDGKVAFAGPFRSYGLIVVIEHKVGYHSVLAGLGKVNVQTGANVRKGEPVGTLGGKAGTNRLYYELRRHGQPVDPLPVTAGLTHSDKGLGT